MGLHKDWKDGRTTFFLIPPPLFGIQTSWFCSCLIYILHTIDYDEKMEREKKNRAEIREGKSCKLYNLPWIPVYFDLNRQPLTTCTSSSHSPPYGVDSFYLLHKKGYINHLWWLLFTIHHYSPFSHALGGQLHKHVPWHTFVFIIIVPGCRVCKHDNHAVDPNVVHCIKATRYVVVRTMNIIVWFLVFGERRVRMECIQWRCRITRVDLTSVMTLCFRSCSLV